MATLRKRRLDSGRAVWEITHGTGAKRIRFVAGQTKEEGQNQLEQFERQLGLHGEGPKELPLAEALKLYDVYIKTNRRENTRKRYIRVLRTFTQCFLGKFHPDVHLLWDVKAHHIEEYKSRRLSGEVIEEKSEEQKAHELKLRVELTQRRGTMPAKERGRFGVLGSRVIKAQISKRTLNYEIQTIFSFFRWAIRSNYAFVNPCAPVEKLRVPKKAMPKFLTRDELRKFLEVCTDVDRRKFGIILLSGMRRGEAEFLTWEDVSLELGVIFIREKEGWSPKTDERLIPISPLLMDLLLEQNAQRTSDKWVFGNEAGNQDTHLLDRLKRNCDKANIRRATVHGLRHSFAVYLRESGTSLADIADLLGHKDLATTQIYAKVQREHLEKQVGRLGVNLRPLLRPLLTEGET